MTNQFIPIFLGALGLLSALMVYFKVKSSPEGSGRVKEIGDEIHFLDVAGTFDTNYLTVARNSHKIQRDASDLTVSVEGAGFTLVYYNSTQGWLLKDV